jgi:hypothetical protein
MTLSVSVTLEVEASPEQVNDVEGLFRDAGVPATVNAGLFRASVGPLPWAVMLEVPLTAFFTALAAAAGTDAWQAMKHLVRDLYDVRRRSGAATARSNFTTTSAA